jgi:hypothetical protein
VVIESGDNRASRSPNHISALFTRYLELRGDQLGVRKQRSDGQVADHQRTHACVECFCHFFGFFRARGRIPKDIERFFLSLLAGLNVSCYREHLLPMQYAITKLWWVGVLPSKRSHVVLGLLCGMYSSSILALKGMQVFFTWSTASKTAPRRAYPTNPTTTDRMRNTLVRMHHLTSSPACKSID